MQRNKQLAEHAQKINCEWQYCSQTVIQRKHIEIKVHLVLIIWTQFQNVCGNSHNLRSLTP